jgi:hypothetical protein
VIGQALAAVLLAAAAPAPAPVPIPVQGATLYPRLIRIAYNPALRGRVLLATLAGLRVSRDEGATWTPLSSVPEPAGTTERCCGSVFELPHAVGSLRAGTLLYAATYHHGKATEIRAYASADGRRWADMGAVARGGTFGRGVWEPEFDVTADGALAVFWSDETDFCCSQRLMRARTRDGRTWTDRGELLRGPQQADRPGMPVVARLPSGARIMVYEMCGPERCRAYTRRSADGWTYDAPELVETGAGERLLHAPTVAFVPGVGGGRVAAVGQLVEARNGTPSPHSGRVLLVRAARARGPWATAAAPVPVPAAYDNYCPNYSSALLPSADGRRMLMVASAYDAAGKCRAYAATGTLASGR